MVRFVSRLDAESRWRSVQLGIIFPLVSPLAHHGYILLIPKWRSYNLIKKQMQGSDPTYQTTSSQHLLAAAEASAVTAMLTNPIWVVKTRVFASTLQKPTPYKGLIGEPFRQFCTSRPLTSQRVRDRRSTLYLPHGGLQRAIQGLPTRSRWSQ